MKPKYQEMKQPENPIVDLLRVSNGKRKLTASLNPFGPNTCKNNETIMKADYNHPQTLEKISFRPATTAETLLITNHDFKNKDKEEILNPRYWNHFGRVMEHYFGSRDDQYEEINEPHWLKLGYALATPEGIYINPIIRKNEFDEQLTSKEELEYLKDRSRVDVGYCLLENNLIEDAKDFAFVPYSSFKQGQQDSKEFTKSGLARGLEHTMENQAPILKEITSKLNYPGGIDICGLEPVEKPELKIIGLHGDGITTSRGRGKGTRTEEDSTRLVLFGTEHTNNNYESGVYGVILDKNETNENYRLSKEEKKILNQMFSDKEEFKEFHNFIRTSRTHK